MDVRQNSAAAAGDEESGGDWPEGGFTLEVVDGEYCETEQVCEECNGVRGAITHLFRITSVIFLVGGKRMDFLEFEQRYPFTAQELANCMNIGEFRNPTCTACQEDFRMRAKKIANLKREEGPQ